MRPQSLVLFLAIAFVFPAIGFAQAAAPPLSPAQIKAMGLSAVAADTEAPDFTVTDLSGKAVTLSSLRGKVVLLNFWATWCPPCREEMPSLEKLYQAYKNRKDFVLLAVSVGEKKSVVDQFLAETPYSFRILLDSSSQAGSLYSVSAIPTTYLIDAKGRILAGKRGGFDWSTPAVAKGLSLLLGTN